MRRLLTVFVALAAFLGAATKVNLIDVRPLSTGPAAPYLLLFHPTKGWMPVIPDSGGSIVLDTTGAVATIKAAGAAASQAVDVRDDLTMGGTAVFTTSQTPRGLVSVYRNGVLQRTGDDYTVTGAPGSPLTINMANASGGDFIALVYQR